MEYLDKENAVVLVDATLDDQPPGTIKLITPRFASDFPKAMSTHEIGLKDLVESLMLLGQLPEIHLFIVSISSIQPLSISLSDEVNGCLFKLKDQVLNLTRELTMQENILTDSKI